MSLTERNEKKLPMFSEESMGIYRLREKLHPEMVKRQLIKEMEDYSNQILKQWEQERKQKLQ